MTTCVLTPPTNANADEQLMQALTRIIPEDGSFVVLLNRTGQARPVAFDPPLELDLSPEIWSEIVTRIEDGDDPVVAAHGESSIAATALDRPIAGYAYAVLVMPKRSLDTALQNLDLIQVALGQLRLLSTATEQPYWPS